MKTTDLFAFNRSSKRLNESLAKTFGRKINLETFSVEQLEDARNKLRTQIYTARSSSNFNETVDNDTLSQAQFMHDAIVAELAERDEPIVDNTIQEEAQEFFVMLVGPRSGQSDPYQGPFNSPDEAQAWIDTESPNPEDYEVGEYPAGQFGQYDNGQEVAAQEGMMEGHSPEVEEFLTKVAQSGDDGFDMLYDAQAGKYGKEIEQAVQEMYDDITIDTGYHGDDDFEQIYDRMLDNIEADYGDRGSNDEGGKTDDKPATFNQGESLQNEAYINNAEDAINLLAAIRKQSKMAERGGGEPVRPNQLVNDLWDVMQWIEANMKESIETESKNTGDNMRNLREGEIQQASAIVTAKTMVDRVGRWIEELSGMENDTLLQLGDSIRDEMGQEQAKQFISTVAPAIQSALENLKQARETLSGGVRTLTGEEQPAEMLGGDPATDMAAPAEPDAMNAEPGADMGGDIGGDDFAAAEPAAGGIGDAGREQRESINRQSRLMKVLAG